MRVGKLVKNSQKTSDVIYECSLSSKILFKLFFRTWTLPASSCIVGITPKSWWIFWVPLLLTHVTSRTASQFLKNFKGLAVPTVVEIQAWKKNLSKKYFIAYNPWRCIVYVAMGKFTPFLAIQWIFVYLEGSQHFFL